MHKGVCVSLFPFYSPVNKRVIRCVRGVLFRRKDGCMWAQQCLKCFHVFSAWQGRRWMTDAQSYLWEGTLKSKLKLFCSPLHPSNLHTHWWMLCGLCLIVKLWILYYGCYNLYSHNFSTNSSASLVGGGCALKCLVPTEPDLIPVIQRPLLKPHHVPQTNKLM